MKKNSTPILALFDIDGTLLSAGRSGFIALEEAIVEILGSPRGLKGIRLDGNTDLKAIQQVCQRDGKEFPPPDVISQFKTRYTEILLETIVNRGFVMPGIPELLLKLKRSKIALGLVTGNIREGAKIKLKRFNLDGFFQFGAFGCENPERSHLVGLALERAAKRLGKHFPCENTFLFGDTINDVAACKPWGIRCVAVATGSATEIELSAAGADFVFSTLESTENVACVLTKNSRAVS